MAYSPRQNKIQHFEEACQKWDIERLVNDLVGKTGDLPPAQQRNLKAILLNLSPKEAAKQLEISESTLKPAFSALYRLIENLTQEKSNTVTYKTARFVLASYRKQKISPEISSIHSDSEISGGGSDDRPSTPTNPPNILTPDRTPELTTLEFIGRDRDLTNLASLRKQYKIVLIKAGAGVGKSTLAREFLQTQFKKVIRIEMGLESGNVTPAEEKVSQILRKDFDEEPSRDFGINLDILREKLSDWANPIGVLIDNLEPALDENYRFREKLRGYDALLAVLSDRDVCSFTLITSRRSLITLRARIHEYSLEGLDIEAWRQYFHDCENGGDSEALMQMRDAYNGNAKVMDILHSAIKNRFDGNISAYWRRYKDALLADSELETLISVEMDWLRDNQPDAYKLLCRMGCYRYQDVKTVPFEGLICLLSDVPEFRRAWVVDYLSKTSLIEVKGEYYLHPTVQECAKLRLIENKIDWETTNQKAAQFFRNQISKINTIEDALLGFEIIFHYMEVNDYEEAASVIFELKSSEDSFDNFGFVCWRLGFSQQIILAIYRILEGKNKINDIYVLSGLYRILGYAQNQLGNIHEAIKYHKLSGDIANNYFQKFLFNRTDSYHLAIKSMTCAYLINIGLCYFDLWDLEKAKDYFQDGIFVASYLETKACWIEDNSCLALVKSYLGFPEEAERLIEEAYENYRCHGRMSAWGRTYIPLLIGRTYRNLGNKIKSTDMYQLALSASEENHYWQAKGNVLISLAEFYRESNDFNSAYSYHIESIKLLLYLGAKCDLAEAYFQLGLTYQVMRKPDQAQEYKAKALKLFEDMEAPKQCDRVNKAFEQGAIK